MTYLGGKVSHFKLHSLELLLPSDFLFLNQKSLSSYMKKYAFKNAKTEDLWKVLSEESGVNINSMMECWTKQKGHPVIYAHCKDHVLEFEQVSLANFILPLNFTLKTGV